MIMEKTYTLNVICSNCDWDGSVAILRGVLLVNRECERCGCTTLRKKKGLTATDPEYWKRHIFVESTDGFKVKTGCAFDNLEPGAYGLVCQCPKHSVYCAGPKIEPGSGGFGTAGWGTK